MIRVTTQVDERVVEASIEAQIARNQRMFQDDLKGPVARAAAAVIKGNITGTGKYDPRPIGTFGSPRARYHRGWVESKYGSSRARQSGTKDMEATDRSAQLRDYLRKRVILDTVSKSGGTVVLDRMARQAKASIQVNSRRADPRAAFQGSLQLTQDGGKPRDLLSQYLSFNPQGKALARKAGVTATKLGAGKMRYGLQTGLLADAWYALEANPGRDLSFTLTPGTQTTPGTPQAEVLTRSLARQAGQWHGLMDSDQLIKALRDQGVVVQ